MARAGAGQPFQADPRRTGFSGSTSTDKWWELGRLIQFERRIWLSFRAARQPRHKPIWQNELKNHLGAMQGMVRSCTWLSVKKGHALRSGGRANARTLEQGMKR